MQLGQELLVESRQVLIQFLYIFHAEPGSHEPVEQEPVLFVTAEVKAGTQLIDVFKIQDDICAGIDAFVRFCGVAVDKLVCFLFIQVGISPFCLDQAYPAFRVRTDIETEKVFQVLILQPFSELILSSYHFSSPCNQNAAARARGPCRFPETPDSISLH